MKPYRIFRVQWSTIINGDPLIWDRWYAGKTEARRVAREHAEREGVPVRVTAHTLPDGLRRRPREMAAWLLNHPDLTGELLELVTPVNVPCRGGCGRRVNRQRPDHTCNRCRKEAT